MNQTVLELGLAAVVLAAVVILAVRGETRASRPLVLRLVALGLVAAAAVYSLFVAWRVISPPDALAQAELGAGGSLDVPAHDHDLLLLVRGQLASTSELGPYHLELVSDGKTTLLDGQLDRQSRTRRVTRRVVTRQTVEHLERRHDLPASGAAQVRVKEVSAAITGPITLTVVPHPPREAIVLAAGALATLAAALVDRRTRAKSFVAGAAAVPFALAFLLLEAPHPLEVGYLLRVVPMAILIGLVGAGVFTLLAKLVPAATKEAPTPAPAKG